MIEYKNNMGKKKKVLFFLVSVIVLQLGFYLNFWNVANQYWFDDFQRTSESLIVGRLAASENEGIFFKAGLLGRYYTKKEDRFNQNPYYEEGLEANRNIYVPYYSQIGGQALIFVLIAKISPFSNATNLDIFKFCTSLLFAVILSLFLVWVHKKYGWFSAVITLMLFLLSHWLTVFGRNLYWVTGALYIPFIVMLFVLDRECIRRKREITLKAIGGISILLVFVKCFLSGFELITTSLLMFIVPCAYYSVIDQWGVKKLIYRLISVGTGAIIAVSVYLSILLYQLSMVKGSLAKGLEHLIYSFSKRTSGTSEDLPEIYKESLESSITTVLDKYWNGTAIDLNTFVRIPWESFFRIDYGELLLMFIIFSTLIFVNKKISITTYINFKKNHALVVATWLSFSAPLSWFIIFKGHSYIHTHTNFIAWYMPFCLFGFATIGSVTSSILRDIWNKFHKLKSGYRRGIQLGFLILGLLWVQSQEETLKQYRTLKRVRQSENLYAAFEGYKIYLFEDKLWYLKENASLIDVSTRFFLHVIPDIPEHLPKDRIDYGFDNLDFNYEDQRVQLPWWNGQSNFLIARIELPEYDIKKIRTGQYARKKIIWQTEFKLEQ